MAKKKLAQASPFQKIYERIMGWAAMLLALFHMWFSFARHYFSPERNMSASAVALALKSADCWAGVLLLCAGVGYLVICKIKYPDTWYRVKALLKRCFSRETLLLLCLFLYFLLCCLVQSKSYTNIFLSADFHLFDLCVCVFILFVMSAAAGYEKVKRYMDLLLHIIMLASTVFVLWALWNLFHLNIVTLPNGLQLGMTPKFTFYPGVNQNIGASIGTAMVFIALYMIACHRGWLRLVYAAVLLPHLYTVLMTGSRACYIALLAVIPAFVFLFVWHAASKAATAKRLILCCVCTAAAAAAMWLLRDGAFQIFDRITHFSSYIDQEKKKEPLFQDSGRISIWVSSLKIMFSSPKSFFFGTPLGLIPSTIKETLIAIFGSGKEYAHAHNMILQTGLVAGVPGMLLLLAFLISLSVRCVRVGLDRQHNRMEGAYCLPLAVLGFMIVNMFEPFLLFYFSVMGCVFFLFSGWITALDRKDAGN